MKFMKSRRTVFIVTVLLVAMLSVVGGTFAWFTDSVESTSNEIKSGTLDLELYQKTEEGEWQNVADLTEPMFSYELWEPGYTVWKALKVENKGTLALKWKAMFEMEGEMSKLAEVIDVYARGGSDKPERSEIPANAQDTNPTNPNSQWWYDGTLKDFIENAETNTYGSLAAGEARELTLVLKMREEAGNEYQNLSLGAFNLKIVATQDTVEEDSFDAQYDADALYPGEAVTMKVRNQAEFIAAVSNVNGAAIIEGVIDEQNNRVTVVLNEDILENKQLFIPAGVLVKNIDFVVGTVNGAYLTAQTEQESDADYVTYENCSFTARDGNCLLASNKAHQVFSNCTFSGPIMPNAVDATDATITFNNCSFGIRTTGIKNGFVNCMGGASTFNQCTFDYTGGSTMGSSPAVKWNAINSYSESGYSTAVVLNGCTLTGTGTQKYGSNSTLTINP